MYKIHIIKSYVIIDDVVVCLAYSEESCRMAAEHLGLTLGGKGHPFADTYSTKGCYSYKSGTYAGIAYYGKQGTREEMEAPLSANPYRVNGCSKGKY